MSPSGERPESTHEPIDLPCLPAESARRAHTSRSTCHVSQRRAPGEHTRADRPAMSPSGERPESTHEPIDLPCLPAESARRAHTSRSTCHVSQRRAPGEHTRADRPAMSPSGERPESTHEPIDLPCLPAESARRAQTTCTGVRALCDRCVTKSMAVSARSRSSLM